MGSAAKMKKTMMTQLWRYQQSQAFYSVIFWSLALAGIFFERSQYYFGKYTPLTADTNADVALKMGILMVMVLLMVIIFGFLYDIIFRLWEQSSDILQQRNVYTHYKMQVKWLLVYKKLFIPLMKSSNKDGALDERIAFIEGWVDKLLEEDPVQRLYFDHVEEWVNSDEERWKAPSTEKLLAAYKRKAPATEGTPGK